MNKHFKCVDICSDSLWALQQIYKFLAKKPVSVYVDICQKISDSLEQLRNVEIRFVKVKAHTNGIDFFSQGNRKADKLASACAKTTTSN